MTTAQELTRLKLIANKFFTWHRVSLFFRLARNGYRVAKPFFVHVTRWREKLWNLRKISAKTAKNDRGVFWSNERELGNRGEVWPAVGHVRQKKKKKKSWLKFVWWSCLCLEFGLESFPKSGVYRELLSNKLMLLKCPCLISSIFVTIYLIIEIEHSLKLGTLYPISV